MKVDVQKFMELREIARAREQKSSVKVSAKTADKSDRSSNTKTVKAAAVDFKGSVEERVSALRERSSEGLPVRELGNFIDVRA